MKKLMIAALMIAGTASFAQEGRPSDKREKMEQLKPEQRNELRLKKLTLDLGLNASQQKEMSKIIADQSAKWEAAKANRKPNDGDTQKPTADERFARKNKMLDEQIATNEKVKKILTQEQYSKWEKMAKHRKHKAKAHEGKRKMKAPEGN